MAGRRSIYFYSHSRSYFELSNFAAFPIIMDGKRYPTVEHYFQSMKFITTLPEYAEKIRLASTPKQAKFLGSDRTRPLRLDWNDVRLDVMYKAVEAKFTQHTYLKQMLLDTAGCDLFENSPSDYYWGVGRNRTGDNHLGKILMDIRDKMIRAQILLSQQ